MEGGIESKTTKKKGAWKNGSATTLRRGLPEQNYKMKPAGEYGAGERCSPRASSVTNIVLNICK